LAGWRRRRMQLNFSALQRQFEKYPQISTNSKQEMLPLALESITHSGHI
jgi:hypothetical protein